MEGNWEINKKVKSEPSVVERKNQSSEHSKFEDGNWNIKYLNDGQK